MNNLGRISFNPEIMGGRPCIRGMRITVGTIVGLRHRSGFALCRLAG
jgi:uncharacterized protein (DUF433 family)